MPNHRESLLLSFPDARLSVVDWDPSTHDAVTTAVFNFDGVFKARLGASQSTHVPLVRVDVLSRCVGMVTSGESCVEWLAFAPS